MKKIIQYSFTLILCCIVMSCTKERVEYVKGKDGSTILFGEVAPKENEGKVGDFYLDTKSSLLYGPKNDKGWGTPLSLAGDEGPEGENGEPSGTPGRIYTGSAAPTDSYPSNPKEGDWYLDFKNKKLYPRNKDTWGTPIDLGN